MALYCFLALFVLAVAQGALGDSFSLPLAKKTSSGIALPPRIHRHRGTARIGEINDQNFWFANFTVGAKDDLVLLIDTGSTDVYLNPGLYEPSKSSTDLHDNFTITFATTNPDGSGTETISGPIYEDIVALDHTQLSVSQQPLGVVTDPLSPPSFPHDGLVGFAGLDGSAINSTSWFQHLCSQGSLDCCRFGLAFETDNTGVQYFGKVEYERFTGPLSVAPLLVNSGGEELWELYGDIAVDGKVVERDARIVTDSGTTVIFGPIDSVKALFDAAGIQTVLHPNITADSPTTLDGYYPCSHPPQLGFGFPSISNASEASKDQNSPVSRFSTIFNVLPSQLAENSTDGNCTAVIHGTDEFGSGPRAFWLVGQAFFQGRYIDHNVDDYTMGFANLLNY